MSNNISYIISLSQPAFFTIMTAALEAYKVSQPNPLGTPHVPVETYGNLWGYQSQTIRQESVLHIVLADVDSTAYRQPGKVTPTQGSFEIKSDFVDVFFPELEYIGDFHSHPYNEAEIKTELALERNKLHERSTDDKVYVKDLQANGRSYRLQLITTIFERGDMVKRQSGHLKGDLSCIRFHYENMTAWVKVYVYHKNIDNGKFRKVINEKIALICPSTGVCIEKV
jgi:hypothetical protein